MKARDIEKKYPPEKAKKLISLLRQKNLFYWDEDFPGDEEDRGICKCFAHNFISNPQILDR